MKNLTKSVSYESKILRLKPQNDIVTQSLYERGIEGVRSDFLGCQDEGEIEQYPAAFCLFTTSSRFVE